VKNERPLLSVSKDLRKRPEAIQISNPEVHAQEFDRTPGGGGIAFDNGLTPEAVNDINRPAPSDIQSQSAENQENI
jgi:hypothetical protein